MDKVIATVSNIEWIYTNKYSYLVVSRELKRIFYFNKVIDVL
jgi:hypothetical protein